jgi:HK97 family phage major capsid protein
MDEIKALLDQAKEKVLAGKLDEAKSLREQAAALREIREEEVKSLPPRPVVDSTKRLDFGSGAVETEQDHTKSVEGGAIKAAYIRQFGKDLDSDVAQIYKELYGTTNYPMLRAMKMADVNNYLRTNRCDPKLEKMVLLAPEQIMAAIISGVPVSSGTYSIKATQVEAQDTLGGVLVPEEINQEWVQRAPGLTVVRARARKFNTSRDALSFIVRTGGNKKYIGAIRSKQTSESPSAGTYNTNATFGKLAIPVHVNLSKVFVSKSMLEDGGVDMLKDVLMPEYVTEAAITEDRQFLTGTGADEPQGICAMPPPAGRTTPTLPRRVSGAAAAITFDGAGQHAVQPGGPVPAAQKCQCGVCVHQHHRRPHLAAEGRQGRYLWAEMYGNNAVGNPDTLRGWVYAETEQLPEVAANAMADPFW